MCAGKGWSKALQDARPSSPRTAGSVPAPRICRAVKRRWSNCWGRNLGLTAVFAYNDSMAAGALTTLKDNGIVVPQHLSLIGFDDIPISR
ncbi:DNA-binding transcriptional regulator GalS, partial [Klebsiella pneumoniae]